MKHATPIDTRLVEGDAPAAQDPDLLAALRAYASAPPPALPESAMRRIGRTLGQRPRKSTDRLLKVTRLAVVLASALVAVEAGAVAGRHVLDAWNDHVHTQELRARKTKYVKPRVDLAPVPMTAPTLPAPSPDLPPVPALSPRSPSEWPHDLAERAPRGPPLTPPGSAPEDATHTQIAAPPEQPMLPLVLPAPHEAVEPTVVASPVSAPVAVRLPLPTEPTVTPAAPPVAGPMVAPSVAAPPAPAGPNPLAIEAAQLKLGLEQRKSGNLVLAAATLEQYLTEHPHGVFWREAALSELDVQLTLGHDDEARKLVAELGDDPALPRAAEVQLVRAELATRAGHWSEALPVFDRLIAETPELAERALYGRAVCLQGLQQLEASRHEFESYLSRYPNGRFAAEAHRALGVSP